MNTLFGRGHPLTMNEAERPDLVALERVLTLDNGFGPTVIAPDGGSVPMPDSLRQLLHDVTQLLIAGDAVEIVAFPPELTVAQAAEFLDERIKDVQRLIDNGHISTIEGASPARVRLGDLIAFRDAEKKQRSEALDELLRLSQEMGAYTSHTKK